MEITEDPILKKQHFRSDENCMTELLQILHILLVYANTCKSKVMQEGKLGVKHHAFFSEYLIPERILNAIIAIATEYWSPKLP